MQSRFQKSWDTEGSDLQISVTDISLMVEHRKHHMFKMRHVTHTGSNMSQKSWDRTGLCLPPCNISSSFNNSL